MGLAGALRRTFEQFTGLRVASRLPRGVDLFRDVADALPELEVRTVLDVGANVGQSAREYLRRWPRARVHCFEPVAETFAELERNLAGEPRARCHRVALGAAEGDGRMVLAGTPDMHFLSGGRAPATGAPVESVLVRTLDAFCAEHAIAHVNLLKVDTEGGDLDVLRGAGSMLAAARIDLVEVEAGMHPGNTRHVPFEALRDLMAGHGYLLFGFYEQTPEWPSGAPHLRRTDPVFLSPRLARGRAA